MSYPEVDRANAEQLRKVELAPLGCAICKGTFYVFETQRGLAGVDARAIYDGTGHIAALVHWECESKALAKSFAKRACRVCKDVVKFRLWKKLEWDVEAKTFRIAETWGCCTACKAERSAGVHERAAKNLREQAQKIRTKRILKGPAKK